MEDERFAHVGLDPKFRRIPKAERKVKIDKRFKSMFKDKQFKIKYTVDKRGRPVNHTSSEDLKRYYELDSDESSIESDGEAEPNVKVPSSDHESNSHNRLDVKDQNDGSVSGKIKGKLRNLNIDYARGESTLFSESSSDDDDEGDTDEDDTVEHAWGALDADAERTEEITKRLAACNMDWDRIRATDLMLLLSSFLPPGGLIESVTIYPSEFGKKRIEEDEIKGPVELIETRDEDPENEENDGEEGSTYHMEKLRQYQLNRLKYYYAVIVCDCKNSANKIYTECDGMEYESSATKMDLRFIPDEMSFEDEPKEVCEKLPEQGKYKPRFFTTTALQQAKVDCTWDETNPDRIELTQKLSAGDEIAKDDLQAYLASSSSSENEESDHVLEGNFDDSKKSTALNKYKSLLRDIENQENEKYKKGVDMEISWELDLKDKTEKLVKKKLDEKEEKTPFQQFLDKRKEKKKAKREEHKKKQTAESESDSDIPSDIDMNDPYFAEEFDKPEFKRKKNKSQPAKEDDSATTRENAAELELLLMNTDDKKHFSLQKIQDKESGSKSKKKLKKKKEKEPEIREDDFKINLEDARFSALYTSHHYNVDPTDSHYKKTQAMDAFVTEKFKRRAENIKSEVKNSDNHKKGVELKLLVKSVKRKTEALGTKVKKVKS